MSRVLLVNPSYNYPVKQEMYPSGALLLLGTMAKLRGHEVKIVHMVSDGMSADHVATLAANFDADIIGITINTFQVSPAKLLMNILKTKSKARIVIGGPHPSSVGADAARVEFPNADSIICGEGEHRFIALLDWVAVKDQQDLEYITPPDLSLVNLSRFKGAYPLGRTPAMFSMMSRGCIGRCSFCNRSVFGNRVRYRSPENVLQELRYFAAYGIKEVFIQDDTFNLNRAWYEEILHGIISEGLNKKMRFRAPFRADTKLVDSKMLRLAKKAGFWLIFYGVESGNQSMLDSVHKKLSLGEIERAVRLTKEAGLKVETSFIIGLPRETEQTARDTMQFYRKLTPFWSGCGVAIPFPSTEIAHEMHAQIKEIPYGNYRPGMVYFRTSDLSEQKIQDFHTKADKLMMRDKIRNMMLCPDVLIRTIRDKLA